MTGTTMTRAPIVMAEAIVPGGSRGLARAEKLRRRRRLMVMVLALMVIVALLGWLLFGGSNRPTSKAAVAAPVGRTQSTLLIQVSGPLGAAVDSALVAHDSAHHSGVVVLIPSQVIAQVPGFGAMPFGQALTVGSAAAPAATLSDLVGVTVDGSWTLSQQAFAALIDALGGVTVTVDRDVTRAGAGGTSTIVVPAGTARLAGSSAVAFATFLASGETEQSRLARFDAVFGQVLSELPKTVAGTSALLARLGSGSASTESASELSTVLVGLAADNAANTVVDQVLPVTALDTGDGQQSFTLDAAKTAQLVSQQLGNSVPASLKATGNRVEVENQVGTPGIGESTRSKLLNAGFVYQPGPNAFGMPNATAPSVVLIFGTTAADIAKGDAVAKALGLPASDVKVSSQTLTVADVVAIIGADYRP